MISKIKYFVLVLLGEHCLYENVFANKPPTYLGCNILYFSVGCVFASAKMPKFHGQMQNISVSEGTPKVTFKCALTNGFYGRLGRNKVSNFLNTYT